MDILYADMMQTITQVCIWHTICWYLLRVQSEKWRTDAHFMQTFADIYRHDADHHTSVHLVIFSPDGKVHILYYLFWCA